MYLHFSHKLQNYQNVISVITSVFWVQIYPVNMKILWHLLEHPELPLLDELLTVSSFSIFCRGAKQKKTDLMFIISKHVGGA